MASRMPESDELPALISIVTGSLPPPCWMVSTLSLVAMAALLSFDYFCCQRLCLRQLANANGVFPAIALPVVVALKADELLVVEVAVNKSALFSAVLAVWKLSSALFSVP